MKFLRIYYLFFYCVLLLSAQLNAQKSDSVNHVIFLVGDAGEPEEKSHSVFDELVKQANEVEGKSTIFFLGDNIYPNGLPPKNKKNHEQAKQIIDYQINRLKALKSTIYFIPGNHDWNQGKRNGLTYINNQQKYLQDKFEVKDVLIPERGCPGPYKVKISKKMVVIAIDTQWWLHQYEKGPIETGDCDEVTKKEVIASIKEILEDNQDKTVLIVGHHPLITKGEHNGYSTFSDHLFPLTNLNKNLYLPLPFIGSIYPLYRKKIGALQDVNHAEYQEMIKELQRAFWKHPNLIYAAGHEHNLQYFEKTTHQNHHYIVSGSGSKTTPVKKLKSPNFSAQEKGFFKLTVLHSGKVIMEVWQATATESKLLLTKVLVEPKKQETKEEIAIEDSIVYPKTMTLVPGENYEAGFLKSWLLGEHYRKAWQTPVEAPVLDMHEAYGGLTPIQRGGGQQTKSLRLKAADGNEYVFRSIQKDPSAALPEELRNTAAAEVVQDQISTSHPYGAFVISPMAEAVGILHTKPQLVAIPNDPHLLEYREDFANQLMLFEQRAAKDVSSTENFGYTTNAINSQKLIQKVLDDHNFIVDEEEMLRNRLFDMLIGDWDRHEDQWRWAEYTCAKENHEHCSHLIDNNNYYIPIPRDRDQAFVKFDGLIPRLAGRKWVVRKLQHFDYDIRDISGMNFNGRYIDRSFLTRLNKQEWLSLAAEMQQNLTDSVIINAIKLWPDTIYKLDGEEITAKLLSRRDKLQEFAERYYLVLAKNVNVVGSNKSELFEVVRVNDTITSVKVYHLKKGEKGSLYYSRDFNRFETKEIRIYGLGGKDVFTIEGEVNKGILVRVIGGEGNDEITDVSNVKGLRKKTKFYDTKKEQNIVVCEKNNELKNLVSYQKMINEYDRTEFKYDMLIPQLFVGYNVDDGLFLGGGVLRTKHLFRKKPFAYQQRFVANRAIKTSSFNIEYNGRFVDIIKKLDIEVEASINAPNSTTNFYGLGNETQIINGEDRSFHLVRFNETKIQPNLIKNIGKFNEIRLGTSYQHIDVEASENRFITSAFANDFVNSLTARNYLGAGLQYTFNNTDSKVIPTRGINFHVGGSWQVEAQNRNMNFGRLESQFAMYLPFGKNVTFSSNVKGVHLIDKFEFFQAATIGAQNRNHLNGDLRGFRRDRFSGRTSLTLNQDLRIKLANFKTYLFPGQLGVLGFFDLGRVWTSNDSSKKWHNSVGGGLWVSPFEMLVINASYAVSSDENLFILKMGFLF
ncbi:MAG: hypothetical protein CVT95_01390 [Bacteroidetes bacterium HGW-Bacteroidetes-12]|nr:MAG: hypothetical protein CVT95_01390 [Bacteroidetes bacterium HGW-Bacteroidetes-12]